MKQMPRVATFLKNFTNYHVTYPSEAEAAQAKKQPRVRNHNNINPIITKIYNNPTITQWYLIKNEFEGNNQTVLKSNVE